MIATYGQVGVPQDAPDAGHVTFGPVAPDSPDADRVAFGLVAADNGFRVAAYDVFGQTGGGIAGSSAAPAYGMLTDRFGVTWIFGVTAAHAG
jgi:PhnB protein